VKWKKLVPDERHSWLHDEESAGFAKFMPVGSKEAKASESLNAQSIFRTYCLGLATKRDDVVYAFKTEQLAKRIEDFVDTYNAEVFAGRAKGSLTTSTTSFRYEKVKLERKLEKQKLRSERFGVF